MLLYSCVREYKEILMLLVLVFIDVINLNKYDGL